MLAAGAAALALLALPSLASATPGTGPASCSAAGDCRPARGPAPTARPRESWLLVGGSARCPCGSRANLDRPRHARAPRGHDAGRRARARRLAHGRARSSRAAGCRSPRRPGSGPALDRGHPDRILRRAVPPERRASTRPRSWPRVSTFDHDGRFGDAYYLEQTYGQIAFTEPVSRRSTIAGPTTAPARRYDIYNWSAPPSTRPASAIGLPALRLRLPEDRGVTGSGQAEIGGRYVWINGDFSLHPRARAGPQPRARRTPAGCSARAAGRRAPSAARAIRPRSPYDDPFDAMGRAPPSCADDMEHKLALHPPPGLRGKVVGVSVRPHGAHGDAHGIAGGPADPEARRRQLLRRVPPPIGFFDSQAPLLAGVLIRTEAPVAAPTTPTRRSSTCTRRPGGRLADAAMDVGQVFSDQPARHHDQGRRPGRHRGSPWRSRCPRDTLPPECAQRPLGGRRTARRSVLRWSGRDRRLLGRRPTSSSATERRSARRWTTDFTDSGLVPGTTVELHRGGRGRGAATTGPATAVRLVIPGHDAAGGLRPG